MNDRFRTADELAFINLLIQKRRRVALFQYARNVLSGFRSYPPTFDRTKIENRLREGLAELRLPTPKR